MECCTCHLRCPLQCPKGAYKVYFDQVSLNIALLNKRFFGKIKMFDLFLCWLLSMGLVSTGRGKHQRRTKTINFGPVNLT